MHCSATEFKCAYQKLLSIVFLSKIHKKRVFVVYITPIPIKIYFGCVQTPIQNENFFCVHQKLQNDNTEQK